jgi:hypothetical protein
METPAGSKIAQNKKLERQIRCNRIENRSKAIFAKKQRHGPLRKATSARFLS